MTRRLARQLPVATTVAMAAILTACAAGPQDVRSITPSELAQRIEAGTEPVVLDVRTEQEFAAGHIPGALNVPHDQLAARLPTLGLDRDAEIVVHCEGGRRAMQAEQVLAEAGYGDVRDLEGHMKGWRDAGLPTE